VTCREALEQKGLRILEVHPEGGEFVCTGSDRMTIIGIAEALESLDFWDYTSPLSSFELRRPWWDDKLDAEDERIFLVMGDPGQEV